MTQEQAHSTSEDLHVPERSYWPIVLAGTMTLSIAGLLAHFAIAIAGAVLSLLVIVAWALEKFQGPEPASGDHGEGAQLRCLDGGTIAIDATAEAGRSSRWWGLVWFITTEALFFANLIIAYLFLRIGFHSHGWPPPDIPHRELLFPSVNTVILLLSGVPAYYGQQAMKRGDRKGLQLGFVLAVLLGAIFLAGQGYEYLTIGFTPQTNVFAAGFFLLTGFHGTHVIAGIGLLLFVFVRSLRGQTINRHSFAVEVAGTYWHFVDAVWIFLFAILYLFQ